jgi:hypothetical protein
LQCLESTAEQTKRFAWITELKVTQATVQEVAWKGGRERWCIENEGYNTQKNETVAAAVSNCWRAVC